MFRADIRDSKRPLAGLFSLWGKGRKWGTLPSGKTGRSKLLGDPLRALKFRFCRDADQCLDPVNKTRQARNGARPCANGAVASIQLSRFIASGGRSFPRWLSWTTCYVCFSGDV